MCEHNLQAGSIQVKVHTSYRGKIHMNNRTKLELSRAHTLRADLQQILAGAKAVYHKNMKIRAVDDLCLVLTVVVVRMSRTGKHVAS